MSSILTILRIAINWLETRKNNVHVTQRCFPFKIVSCLTVGYFFVVSMLFFLKVAHPFVSRRILQRTLNHVAVLFFQNLSFCLKPKKSVSLWWATLFHKKPSRLAWWVVHLQWQEIIKNTQRRGHNRTGIKMKMPYIRLQSNSLLFIIYRIYTHKTNN